MQLGLSYNREVNYMDGKDFIKVCFIDWIREQIIHSEIAMKILDKIMATLLKKNEEGKKDEML